MPYILLNNKIINSKNILAIFSLIRKYAMRDQYAFTSIMPIKRRISYASLNHESLQKPRPCQCDRCTPIDISCFLNCFN